MKTDLKIIDFDLHQCVLIENEEQYKLYFSQMRSGKTGISFEDWKETYGYTLKFPCYLEHCISVTRGHSLGRTRKPIGTWSKKPLEVLKH